MLLFYFPHLSELVRLFLSVYCLFLLIIAREIIFDRNTNSAGYLWWKEAEEGREKLLLSIDQDVSYEPVHLNFNNSASRK